MVSGEVRNLLFSVIKREEGTLCSLGVAPIQYSALFLFALRRSCVNSMTFQTIDFNVRTSQELDFRLITTSKNNLREIHISRTHPKISPLSRHSLDLLQQTRTHSSLMKAGKILMRARAFEKKEKIIAQTREEAGNESENSSCFGKMISAETTRAYKN